MKRSFFIYVLGLATLIGALGARAVSGADEKAGAATCFSTAGTENVPFFSVTYPEPEMAVLHLNGENIFAYMKKEAELNPGTVEADHKIISISKYPIPCGFSKGPAENPPRIHCHFSDRYSVSFHSYIHENKLISVADLVISEPQYGGAFTWGPRLYCKNAH
jgi:hypothetical protein